jgi:putative transposase
MAESCTERGVAMWAYCLMPNHIHLIAVPQSEDASLRCWRWLPIGEAC